MSCGCGNGNKKGACCTPVKNWVQYTGPNQSVIINGPNSSTKLEVLNAAGQVVFDVSTIPTGTSTGTIYLGGNTIPLDPTLTLGSSSTGFAAVYASTGVFSNVSVSNTGTFGNIAVSGTGTIANVTVSGTGLFQSIITNSISSVSPILTPSDERLKEQIRDLGLGLDFINKIQPKQYVYKRTPNVQHSGFLAQQVKDVLCDMEYDTSGIVHESEHLHLSYIDFIAPLVKSVQELSEKVNELESRLIEQ
jgi:hypothetical protein